jgi:hypothetical protein
VYGNYWVLPKLMPLPIDIEDTTDGSGEHPIDSTDETDTTDRPGRGNRLDFSISSLGPNPTHDVVTLEIQSHKASESQLALYDVMGERVWQSKVLPLKEGRNDFTVDTRALGLPTGSYIITVQSGSHFERRKLIVLHN